MTGAVTSAGDEVTGRVTLSSLDPQQTFVRLLPSGLLDGSFLEEVARYRYRGSSGKVNLALDGLPEFTCLPGAGDHLRGAISFSPSIDYMEQAYDDAKSGRFSRRPYIDMVIPTLVDPSMAPPGKHVMSCFVQYAPYHLAEGDEWDDGRRDAFGETVIDTIAERAPNIRELILHAQVLTPKDIEDTVRALRGKHLPGRALARAALLQPARAGMGALPDAAAEPLDVRLGHAPRGWDHGRVGTPRGAAGPARASRARRPPEAWPGSDTTRSWSGPATTAWSRLRTWRRRGSGRWFSSGEAGRAALWPPRRSRPVCARRLRPTASEVSATTSSVTSGSARTASAPSSRRWRPSPRPPTGPASRCGATRSGRRRSSGRGPGRAMPRRSSPSTAGSARWAPSWPASRRPSRRTSRLRPSRTPPAASRC